MGFWDRFSFSGIQPIWRYSSLILGVETEEVELEAPPLRDESPYRAPGRPEAARDRRVTAILYSGQRATLDGTDFVLRRLEFVDGSPRIAWEYAAPEPGILAPERYGRLAGSIVAPVRMGGVAAVNVRSGAVQWILPYPVFVGRPPARTPEGDLYLEFLDGARYLVDPATGLPRERGPGATPRTPLIRAYALGEVPVGERLVWLERQTPKGVAVAIGAVEPGGGGAVPVVDLGVVHPPFGYEACYEIDRLLAFRVTSSDASAGAAATPRRTTYLVDPHRWRVLARIPWTDGMTARFYAPPWGGML